MDPIADIAELDAVLKRLAPAERCSPNCSSGHRGGAGRDDWSSGKVDPGRETASFADPRWWQSTSMM
jgi:hypothetical protein